MESIGDTTIGIRKNAQNREKIYNNKSKFRKYLRERSERAKTESKARRDYLNRQKLRQIISDKNDSAIREEYYKECYNSLKGKNLKNCNGRNL